jgi:hypothetical protein
MEQKEYEHQFMLSGADYAEYLNLLREKEMNSQKCCDETVGLNYESAYRDVVQEHCKLEVKFNNARKIIKRISELI